MRLIPKLFKLEMFNSDPFLEKLSSPIICKLAWLCKSASAIVEPENPLIPVVSIFKGNQMLLKLECKKEKGGVMNITA